MNLASLNIDRGGQDLPVRIDVQGEAAGEHYLLQVKQARWTDGGQHLFSKSACLVEYVLDPGAGVEAYAGGSDTGDYALLRGASFFPTLSEVHCRWRPGRQRSLTCSFDLSALLAEADVEVDPAGLPAAVDIRSAPLTATLRQLTEETLSPQFASALQIQCLMISAAIHLSRAVLPASVEATDQGRLGAAQMQALRDLVESGAALTLGEMARACGVSPRRLSTLYRNTAGRTLRSYVAAAKIQRAHSLLAQGAPIKQVAHTCGFLSVTAFTAAFRKTTGTTPSRFRL